jgi:DNA-binding NarL/FixJ family response regulator
LSKKSAFCPLKAPETAGSGGQNGDMEGGGSELEQLARAAYLDVDFEQATSKWEQAYAAYRQEGDHAGAVRSARNLAFMYGSFVGDAAVMSGWMARAQTLLGEGRQSREGGWVALSAGMFAADRQRKEEHFREALALAQHFGDTELELATLAYLGASLVHDDRAEEGMALLDEALAGAAGSEVDDPIVLGEIFCQLFSACEYAHDVSRADQWCRIGEAIAERRNLPAVSAFCRTHYGGILTAAGRWTEADTALSEAASLWGAGHRGLRPDALTRLAELRVRQGRLEEAEQLLHGLDRGAGTARPMASVHLARGETSLARDVLERALDEIDPASTGAAPLLAQLVEVHLAAGSLGQATAAADQLAACAAHHPSAYVTATAALARGRICRASGDGDVRTCLRAALAGFTRAQMPMEAARARLALADALGTEQPEVAIAEARAALHAFERLDAPRDANAAAALLRELGVRTSSPRRVDGVLTKREAEVLDLLGHGLSNPEISDRLYISRKTVEHHVGNVLAKLGLRSRAEAAAYATRRKPAEK